MLKPTSAGVFFALIWGLLAGWGVAQPPDSLYQANAREFFRQWAIGHCQYPVYAVLQIDNDLITKHTDVPYPELNHPLEPHDTLPTAARNAWFNHLATDWQQPQNSHTAIGDMLPNCQVVTDSVLRHLAKRRIESERVAYWQARYNTPTLLYYHLSAPIFSPDYRFALMGERLECLSLRGICSCWGAGWYWRHPDGRWLEAKAEVMCS